MAYFKLSHTAHRNIGKIRKLRTTFPTKQQQLIPALNIHSRLNSLIQAEVAYVVRVLFPR